MSVFQCWAKAKRILTPGLTDPLCEGNREKELLALSEKENDRGVKRKEENQPRARTRYRWGAWEIAPDTGG